MQPPPPPPPGAAPPSASPPPPPGGYAPVGAPPPGYQAYTPHPIGMTEFAGFWQRFLAMIVDGVLYGLLALLLAAPGLFLIRSAYDDCVRFGSDGDLICPPGEPAGTSLAGGSALIGIAAIIVIVIYIRALGKTGQTWGRKLAGVKVVDATSGAPIGVGKAFGRQLFANIISGQILYLGYLWMLWDNKNQTWHDKVVGSVVVEA